MLCRTFIKIGPILNFNWEINFQTIFITHWSLNVTIWCYQYVPSIVYKGKKKTPTWGPIPIVEIKIDTHWLLSRWKSANIGRFVPTWLLRFYATLTTTGVDHLRAELMNQLGTMCVAASQLLFASQLFFASSWLQQLWLLLFQTSLFGRKSELKKYHREVQVCYLGHLNCFSC